MKRALAVLLLPASLALAQTTPPPAATTQHVFVDPAQVKWGDAPPFLNKGARFAVLSGDPSKPGIFVARLKMPPGYKIQAHTHPTDEHVTVISGALSLGMGDKLDMAKATTLKAGSYANLPAEMRHYAFSKGGAVVQIHGMGPFALNYVNPADDPSKSAAK